MVEHFDQDSDALNFSGRSFRDKSKAHGYWHSDSVTIDVRKARLIFMYSFEVVARSSSLYGMHTSFFDRESPYSPPKRLSGFAHDLNDPTRIIINSTKISEQLLPWDDAIKVAIAYFGEATGTQIKADESAMKV